MRKFLFLLVSCSGFAQTAIEDEEALSLRRIADFWQEGEYQLAKNQIETYLEKFPDSDYYDTLCVALGDLCLREKNYTNALNYYSRITSSEWKDSVFLSRMQCLYSLEWYATLADECDEFLARDIAGEQKIQATYYLAIGLYQQCLNAKDDPDQLEALALRAQPHFTTLLDNKRSSEVSQAFAYLCCVLKEFPRASDIYLTLAQEEEFQREHLLFQAALLQSQFDKEKAIQTFREVADLKQTKAQDAAFNYLVLNFELERYEMLVEEKEKIFSELASSRLPQAHLLFGQTFFHLKDYEAAIKELSLFAEASLPYETLRPGLIYLLTAAHKASHLAGLEKAIDKLSAHDSEYPQALLVRSILLKKEGKSEEATNQLIDLLAAYSEFPQKAQALFELVNLEYENAHWKSCHAHAKWFLQDYAFHESAPDVWRYLIAASAQLSATEELDQRSLKKQFSADLERAFKQAHLFSETELLDWQFLLAKTYYEIHDYKKSFAVLEHLLKNKTFPQQANAYLLMALLQKDRSVELFCQYAERALELKADLVQTGQVHIALFNAYLERAEKDSSFMEKAAGHLFSAFCSLGTLQSENLSWLATYYYHQAETNAIAAERAAQLFEQSPKTPMNAFRLAKLYSRQDRTVEQVQLLEKVKEGLDLEAKLLLAEGYIRLQNKEAAITLLETIIAESPTARSFVSASATLQMIRLKKEKGMIAFDEAASGLKNLIIQRRLANEPVHLEAALDYIALQSATDLEKKLALLKKTKADFEAKNDLLSNDYHEARQKLPAKDRIYQLYIQLFEADICLCEAKLAMDSVIQAKWNFEAKRILLQINADPIGSTLLGKRINDRLQQLNSNESGI